MKEYKKIFIIITLIFLSSCGKGCIEADDFGISGDFDMFTVFANSSNCSWNNEIIVNDNTNAYIKNCLLTKNANSIPSMLENGSFDIDLVEHIKSVSGKIGKDIGDNLCSVFDIADTTSSAFSYVDNFEVVGLGEKNTIFSFCLRYCQDLCSSAFSQDESLWDKANLKTSSSSLGIDIGNNTLIKIKATGAISLSEENSGTEMLFKYKSKDEIAQNTFLPANAKINLNIILSKNIPSTPPVSVDITNYSETVEKIYLKFDSINGDLVLDQTKLITCSKYKGLLMAFQEPKYYSIDCQYSKTSFADHFTNKLCNINYSKPFQNCGMNSNDYKNAFINRLNSFHTLKKINSDVFSDNFYYYANLPALDYLYYDFVKKSLTVEENSPFNIEKFLVTNGFALNVELPGSNNKFLDGYFWTTGNDFSFSVNRPLKLAIKQFSNSETCSYIVEESKNGVVQAKFPVDNNKYFTYTSGGLNKWQVLKKSNELGTDNEIVFNPFSVGDFKNEVVLTIKAMDNFDVCSNVLIKLIQLKDHEINETGFVFFNINNSGNILANKEIKYTLLNRNSLSVPITLMNGITVEDRYSNFFEFSDDRFTIKNEKIKLITDIELDEKVDGDDFSAIYDDKSIFVRKGQFIRFDYSSWFNIDGLDKMQQVAGWTYITEDNSTYSVPFGLGLMSVIKKNSAFICLGSGKKVVNVSEYCGRNNGNFSVIPVASNQTMEKCFIREDNCIATKDDQVKLKNFDSGNDGGCYISQQVNQSFFDDVLDLKVFVSNVYNVYKNATPSKLNCSNLINLISELYDKTKSCINYLANSSTKYEIYLPTLKKNTTSDTTTGFENSYYVEDIYKLGDGTLLKNFFPTTKPTLVSGGNGQLDIIAKAINLQLKNYTKTISSDITNEIYIYDTFFYYYRKDLCSFDETIQACLVDGVPFCYNLNNYKGSISSFIKNTVENTEIDVLIMQQFGKLVARDRAESFGASLISSFVGKGGNISNFNYSGVDTADNIILTPQDPVILDSNSYVSLFYIKDFSTTKGTTSYEHIKNSLKETMLSSQYAKIKTTSLQNFRNGERLAIFLGRNAASYKSDTPSSITSGFSSSDILHVIQYSKTGEGNLEPTDSNQFSFRTDGVLINKNTLSSSLITKDSYFFDYTSGIKTNLFFKIMDTDGNAGNNSGSYNITVNTVQVENGESWLINAFSGFFGKIIEVMDGQKIKLQFNSSKSLIKCEESVFDTDINKELCTRFNLDNISKNGEICLKGESYCYRNCKNMDRTAIVENKCKSVHDGNGFLKNVFVKLLTNILFNFTIKISFILMLTFYGFNFFLGKSKFTYSEMLIKILRMCFIYFMLSESGWDFFNNYFIGFFKQGIDSLLFTIASAFETSLDSPIIQAVETGDYSNKMAIFSSGFKNIELLFSKQLMYKLTGLAFSSIFGLIYLYLLLTTILSYVVAVLTSLVIYLNAQIYMSFVMSLFPIVLLFLVFDKTKKSLDNWFNMIVGFVFQQIFLVLTISFFNNLIYNLIISVFAYRVCWLPIFNLKISGLVLFVFAWWKIPNIGLTASADTGLIGGPSFYNIMFFYIVGVLMGKFVTGMTELGNSIAGGKNSITGGIAGFASGGLNAMKGQLEGGAKKIGSGVYERAAGSVGLDTDGEKTKKADEARKNRNAARKDVADNSSKSADKKLSDYRKSDNFKKDMQSKEGYNTANNTTKKKMEEKHLGEKRNEFQHKEGVEEGLKNEKMLNRLGTSKEGVENMGEEQKKNLYTKMESMLENDGLIKPLPKKEDNSVDINKQKNDEPKNDVQRPDGSKNNDVKPNAPNLVDDDPKGPKVDPNVPKNDVQRPDGPTNDSKPDAPKNDVPSSNTPKNDVQKPDGPKNDATDPDVQQPVVNTNEQQPDPNTQQQPADDPQEEEDSPSP